VKANFITNITNILAALIQDLGWRPFFAPDRSKALRVFSIPSADFPLAGFSFCCCLDQAMIHKCSN
jgi:hypothetical protein